jgi:hypothetical protein
MRRTLYFKRVFVEPIKTGRKTQTLRLRTRLQAGDVAIAKCGREVFAVLDVLNVERVTLGALDERDATREGFGDLDELRRAWNAVYPRQQWRDDVRVNRIRFRVRDGASA